MAARARKNAGGDAPGSVKELGEQVDYEAAMARLQEVVAALEAGDLPLERGVALYKEGLGLSRACRERLRTARPRTAAHGPQRDTPVHRRRPVRFPRDGRGGGRC